MGIGADRAQFYNCSSAEGEKFAEVVKTAVEIIRSLGQNPFKAEPAKLDDHHE
jgi:coenzyme F420-reducing hydrogenase delta subunit